MRGTSETSLVLLIGWVFVALPGRESAQSDNGGGGFAMGQSTSRDQANERSKPFIPPSPQHRKGSLHQISHRGYFFK